MLFPCPVFCAAPPPPVFLRRTPAVASRSAQGKYEGRGQGLDRSRAGSRVRSTGIARSRARTIYAGDAQDAPAGRFARELLWLDIAEQVERRD